MCRQSWLNIRFRTTLLPMQAFILAVLVSELAVAQNLELARSGIIYSIGTVERVNRGSALIDLGDIHSVGVLPGNNRLAVFRLTASRYVPVGVLQVAETQDTFCQTRPAPGVYPEPGDIVLFVRELFQLESAANHRDNFIRQQIIKTGTNAGYSTMRRASVATAMRDYARDYRKWERSQADVVGFLNGASWREGRETRLTPLLNYIGMLRHDFRTGRNSLSVTGKEWHQTVVALAGPTAVEQHMASQQVEDPDGFADLIQRPEDRDIRREIDDRFFDRRPQERLVLAYLLATMLEASPRNADVWFRQQLLRSQFPELSDEPLVREQFREAYRSFQD